MNSEILAPAAGAADGRTASTAWWSASSPTTRIRRTCTASRCASRGWTTDDESHWARVATPMAGKGAALYFLPEVDDEVLVAFEHGSIDLPVRRRVAVERQGHAARIQRRRPEQAPRRITSRSGHVIRLERQGRRRDASRSSTRPATTGSSSTRRTTRSRSRPVRHHDQVADRQAEDERASASR